MGKQQDRIDPALKKQEYIDLFDSIQTEDASAKRNQGAPTDQLVGENNVGFAQQNNIGTTKFDNKVVPGIDFFEEEDMGVAQQLLGDVIAETRAQDQTKGEKLLMGLGRVGAKVGTEFMKGFGYIGGAIPALVMQDIELMTDNFWVAEFQEMEDAAKEALPVYTRKEVEEGSLARQLWSPEFWATDGADGIGFLFAAIFSGGAASAVANSLKIGTSVAKMVGKGAKFANKIDSGIVTGTQTFLESAAETKGMVDGLKAHYEQYRQEDGTYLMPGDNPFSDGITLSQEEVDGRIGGAGVETMAMNGLFLWGPNALQTKYLFGKGDDMADMLKGVPKGSAEEMKKGLDLIKPWKSFAKAGIKSATAEATQELSQFAIESYETKKGKGLNTGGFINGMVDGFVEGLTTIEGQKSMFLGGVLGLGPGAVGGYKTRKAEKKQAGSLLDLMSKSSTKFVDDISSVYQKNEDGSIKLDSKTKKPIVDNEKFFELMDSQSQDVMTSKLYQEAKQNKDVASAKFALSEMTIRNIFPYLQTAGGMELWKEHTSALGEVIENDAADLGFDNAEEYSAFLEETAQTAKKEYKKIKNLGPAFFGIDTKKLMEDKQDKEFVSQKLEQFIGNIEYNAVRLSALQNSFRGELKQAQEEVTELELTIPRDEDGELTHRDAMLEPFIKSLNKKIDVLKSIITEQGEQYSKLFNQKEQQAAFDSIIAEVEEQQEEVEADKMQGAHNRSFEDTFKANLAEKGYTFKKDEEGNPSDFTTKQVILKDDNGEVFRVDNQWNGKTQTKDFFLKNLKTGEAIPFTVEALREMGLDKAENIVTRGEFAKFRQAERVVQSNSRKMLALNKLIGTHTKSHVNLKYNKKVLVEELAKYSEELNFWKENKNFDESDIAKEINRLQEKVETINVQIEDLENQREDLEKSLKTLRQLKGELRDHIENKADTNFSFDAKINELEAKLLDGDFELEDDIITESIDIIEEWLEPLYVIRDKMQDTVNDLFNVLSAENKVLFEEKDWDKLNDDNRYLLSTYTAKLKELTNAKKQIKELQKELSHLQRNRNLLVKYERLGIEMKNLMTRNNVAKNKLVKNQSEKTLSRNQDKRSASSPKEQTAKEEVQENSAKKHTPWSTVTAVFYIHNKKDKDGNFELSKNWQQAARWSSVMGDIPLSKLDQYQVRFVDNEQLRDITGENPPVNTDNALYAVLYNAGEAYSDENGVIYTGIAHPDTYFNGTFSSIDVTRLPQYKPYRNKPVTKENPATYNGQEYTSKTELESRMIADVANSYTEWRKDISDRAIMGEEMYSGISDISKGSARRGTEKHKPKEVLDITSLEIPDTNTLSKENDAEVGAEAGMVYAKMANGQFEKLKNHSVGELEQAAQDKYINRIVNLMGLFNEMTNQDFKSTFAFKGKDGKATKSRMPLVSNSGTTGILNHYINWGYFSDSTYSISVHPITNDLGEKTSDLEVVINHEGVKIKLPLSELTDERGKSRRNGDPAITQLTDFLKTKYMNVNKKDINNPKNLKFFGLPTGWTKATPTSPPLLTYDKYDSYNDYVLENSLYSDVLKTDESTDGIPTFVNQYITFDEETTPTLPELVIEEEEVTPEKNNAVENADISEEVVEEAVEYADGYYLVDIDNGTIKDAETEKIIDPTSKTGKTVMKKAIAGKETVGTVVDNALAGFTAGPDAGGSTFNNVFKKAAPLTETAENVEAKDKTLCPTAPKGGKKKINRKR